MISKRYKDEAWAQLGESLLGYSADEIESVARGVLRKTANQYEILKGVLTNPKRGMRIGFEDGNWILCCGEQDTYEELCKHDDWCKFIKLCHEYSDFVEGDNG